MTFGNPYEELDEALARLRPHDTSPASAERIRERCHMALAARERPQGHPAAFTRWLEPVAAVCVCCVYLAGAVQVSVAFLRAVR